MRAAKQHTKSKHVTHMINAPNPYDRTPHKVWLTLGDLDTIQEALAWTMTDGAARKTMSKAYHLNQTHVKIARRISRLVEKQTGQF